jgi:hypothetical protein
MFVYRRLISSSGGHPRTPEWREGGGRRAEGGERRAESGGRREDAEGGCGGRTHSVYANNV